VGDAALRPAIPCKLQNTGSRLPRTFVSSPVQQATDRLATVPAGASQLVYQITFGPRRLTPGIPVRQQREGLMIREHETTHQATTHAECVDVAVLAGDRRWQQRQVSLMNIRDRLSASLSLRTRLSGFQRQEKEGETTAFAWSIRESAE